MKKITILALEQALGASVMGPMDIFCLAGLTWNYIFSPETPQFEVSIVTLDGRPVTSFNGASGGAITPHRAAYDIEAIDVILVGSFGSFDTLACADQAGERLKHHLSRGALIGSICIGSYLLAATGLLEGRTATIH